MLITSYNTKKILPVILIKNPSLLNIPQKKFMLTALRNLMYRGNVKKNLVLPAQPNRDLATWNVITRVNEPKYLKPNEKPPMPIDQETGLEIMHATDFSGKNHSLLVDIDYQSDTHYKVYGSFTSAATPFMNKSPIYIGNLNLNKEKKAQYLHHYDKPRLIEKEKVVTEAIHTTTLSHDEYQDVLNKIQT